MRIRKLGNLLPRKHAFCPKVRAPSVFHLPTKKVNEHHPPPPCRHTPHPNSLRYELGLFKYSTGLLSLPVYVRRQSGIECAAYKIYSQQQLLSQARKHTRRLGGDAFAAPLPRTLHASLYQIYAATAKALSLVQGLGDALCQIFGTEVKSKTLFGFKVFPSERQWSLTCQHFQHGQTAETSMPYLVLHSRPLPITRWCEIYLNRNRVELSLRVKIGAHLKYWDQREASKGNAAQPKPGSTNPLQALFDDISLHAVQSVSTRAFEDVNHALSTISHGIIAFLGRSKLTSIVEFGHLEVVLFKVPTKERFVSNIRLNPDGSEPYAPLISPESVDSNGQVVVRTRYRGRYRTLSAKTQDKLGIESMIADISQPADDASLPRLPSTSDIFEEFDTLCGSSQHVGLTCGAAAASLLSRRYPGISGFVLRRGIKLSSARTLSNSASITFSFNTSSPSDDIIIHLPLTGTVRVCLPDFTETVTPCDVEMTLVGVFRGRNDFNTSAQDEHSSATQKEIQTLARMASMVLKAVCGEVVFDSYDAVPTVIAEAALRTIRFPNPDLRLVKARARVVSKESLESSPYPTHAEAKWQGADDKTVPRAPVPDTVQHGIASTAHSDSERNPTHAAHGEDRAITVEPDKLTSAVSHDGVLDSARTRDIMQTGYLRIKHIESRSLYEKTGLNMHQLFMRWQDKDVMAASHFTNMKIEATIEESIRNSQTRGLHCVQNILESLGNLVPPPGLVACELGSSKSHSPESMAELDTRGPFRVRATYSPFRPLPLRSSNMTFEATLPRLTGVRFSLHDRADSSRTRNELHVAIRGTLTHTHQYGQSQASAPEAVFLLKTVDAIVRPTLESSTYQSIDALASDITSVLRNQRELFAPLLNVGSIRVTASLLKGNHPMATEAKGKAHWTEAVSDDVSESNDDAQSDLFTYEPFAGEDSAELLSEDSETVEKYDLSVRNEEVSEDERASSPPLDAFVDEDSTSAPIETSAASGLQSDGPEEHENDASLEETSKGRHWKDRIFIALGSNVGDRVQSIEAACREMDSDPDMEVVLTSSLYETEPMYVEDQARFLNGACEIRTTLSAIQLLDRLQSIEQQSGRVKTIDKGPRNIDLDILLYQDQVVETERLTIPHPLMMEREFVLRPLCDLSTARHRRLPVQQAHKSHGTAFAALQRKHLSPGQPMYPFTPLALQATALRSLDPARRTQIMSILNVTPDSFSDGGDYSSTNTEQLKSSVRSQIASGATIIDIGGQSSRPNAPDVTAEEEIARILPAIEAVKFMPEAEKITISVDTYRAAVARAAVQAGAHVINDISAGMLDPDMLDTIAKLGCTYVMMHMRGTPATMQSDENCSYPEGLISTVASELRARLRAAAQAGIRRWRIVLDPGIGFSKTPSQNLELLREFNELRAASGLHNLPWLVGSSRKSFIGKITGVENPKERGWGTAATVTAAIQGGADIVRVHDAKEMADVVTMADAMYRS